MELRLYKTLWGHTGSLDTAIVDGSAHGFDGIEGQAPADNRARQEWRSKLSDAGLDYIAEICTAGSYVPQSRATPSEHLESFRVLAAAAVDCAPRFLTVLAGSDAWSLEQNVEFFGRALEIAKQLGVVASFETHRSRSTFNPWATRDLLRQLPDLRITCDFSHWCCVTERLVLDTEPEILALCAERAHHIHGRIGYDQGPQVPHPAAPEYRDALKAHERWWEVIWSAQECSGYRITTMTPEFGPDGYLHTIPFTAAPVADLVEINRWMANREREHFSQRRIAAAA
ncbi:sugar phosphate isomerase/epimerase family protein [Verrucomicrobiota bacterium sgz303538]